MNQDFTLQKSQRLGIYVWQDLVTSKYSKPMILANDMSALREIEVLLYQSPVYKREDLALFRVGTYDPIEGILTDMQIYDIPIDESKENLRRIRQQRQTTNAMREAKRKRTINSKETVQ